MGMVKGKGGARGREFEIELKRRREGGKEGGR